MKPSRFWKFAAVITAVLVAGSSAADDRDFLRERAAPPVLIFILDTSGSMVGSPEEPGVMRGARVGYGMVPGAGDDPYSRMGIAKRVLREFLTDVTDATYALAGYAQAQPSDGSNAVPQKHWVYEARDGDRFSLIEPNFAYRLGYAETFAGVLIDNPADILKGEMIGYSPYFDASAPILDRYGPSNAFDTGITEGDDVLRLPYDLLPVYFGSCFIDNKETPLDPTDDETICRDNVFPFYATGERDVSGDMIAEEFYYGDPGSNRFPDCTPNRVPDASNPDDGCFAEWLIPSGGTTIENRRRVQLRIPSTGSGGAANHLRAIDGGGAYVGNEVTADPGGDEDYDLDGEADPDYDGSESSDWVLWVEMIEEQSSRTCLYVVAPTATPTMTPTISPTPTVTFTPTPTWTPTPPPMVDCNDITLVVRPPASGILQAWINNNTAYQIEITRTVVTWEPPNSSYFLDWFGVFSGTYSHTTGTHYWGDGSPSINYGPISDQVTDQPTLARIPAGIDLGLVRRHRQQHHPQRLPRGVCRCRCVDHRCQLRRDLRRLCLQRDADPDPHQHSVCGDTHQYGDAHPDPDSDQDPDLHSDHHQHPVRRHPDPHPHAHTDQNPHHHGDADADPDHHAHAHEVQYADHHADAVQDPDGGQHPDRDATPTRTPTRTFTPVPVATNTPRPTPTEIQ